MAPSAEFTKAAEDSKKLKQTPTNDELLELYALYKIGNAEDFEKATKPGMFDLKGKAKYSAWEKEVKAGTTAADAQTKYVAKVKELQGKYGSQ
ncbi:Acyl-CoA-binding [Fulvia fulva]|uniref:Acyl-CoA-binding n=1 Tax=Passalora fulva TaxID=5499 RepID=A0A9Q8P6V3_PASFU|nr:Acyl-CoA-binding [Fulvia fulva]KAK4629233.1 Acyl-CoA-binding [Fulvia fulva]KAK4630208.1 Acyl-CoA-binding [Fulvia fulva]UJO15227.1 Acyl-CoA-binding [Fulvia fulva]WPV12398.1 Acyl-CoA-binding [Fulvia fulva]WPV27409.1 Acyl-CoA-binding [Fulvia fulva]